MARVIAARARDQTSMDGVDAAVTRLEHVDRLRRVVLHRQRHQLLRSDRAHQRLAVLHEVGERAGDHYPRVGFHAHKNRGRRGAQGRN